ncbi:thermonuclease family protein [Candidatus Pacearchaeota archaeon]|nr:thermonuclease family protein [Candidatus Pacearchaeota archaeon]
MNKEYTFKSYYYFIIMKTLNILVFLLIFNTFILLGFLVSEVKITGKVTYERITINVTRVIDGDTIETEIGKVRLLGINTPEKKNPGYQEAKDFLVQFEGKKIELEDRGKDKYQRTLGYLYYQNKLINSEILKFGLATLYVYNKDENYQELEKAEKYAREQEIGLWKKSENYGCIKLTELKYQEQERCKNQEQLILQNNCENLQVILKDDANHIEKIQLDKGIFTKNFSCVWNDEGDSLYLRDEQGLILFYRY